MGASCHLCLFCGFLSFVEVTVSNLNEHTDIEIYLVSLSVFSNSNNSDRRLAKFFYNIVDTPDGALRGHKQTKLHIMDFLFFKGIL